jgi:hypothetical protein
MQLMIIKCFRYNRLPNGEPLADQLLRKYVDGIIEKYKNRSSSLTNLGFTQANESFNHSVATHAPKNK